MHCQRNIYCRVGTPRVHDFGSRLICAKGKVAGKRPAATLLQLETPVSAFALKLL
jgi:hypothetical protein